MLTVIAQYIVSQGNADHVARLMQENAQESRMEPGCVEFSVYQNIDEPHAILLYERYVDESAFQEHRRTEHFKAIVEGQVAPLLTERNWSRVEKVQT